MTGFDLIICTSADIHIYHCLSIATAAHHLEINQFPIFGFEKTFYADLMHRFNTIDFLSWGERVLTKFIAFELIMR